MSGTVTIELDCEESYIWDLGLECVPYFDDTNDYHYAHYVEDHDVFQIKVPADGVDENVLIELRKLRDAINSLIPKLPTRNNAPVGVSEDG
tara:strand:- start:693 stop:965 length:273 start_codon:yes stop_codon:yes gene_type:complete